MKIHYVSSFFLGSALISSTGAMADTKQQGYSGWSWSANVDHISLDKDVTSLPEVQIGDSATAIGIAAEYFTSANEMTYSIGLNYLIYNDNNEFYQYVDDYWSGHGYEQSDAGAFMLYAELGPKYRFGADQANFITAKAGYSGIFASKRTISNCSDCYSEDLNIDGGLYGSIGIGHSFDRFDLSLQFQQYITGDLNNSLRLKLSSTF